jgi:hypothetical protein
MSTLDIKPGERVKDVHFTEGNLSVDLIDGRTITVPWAINCDLPQSLKLMAFFPAEHPRLKKLVKMIL